MTSYQGDDMGRKYREYTYDDWKKAMELHNKYKLGPTKISRILGISEDTVGNWLYRGVVPPAAKWIAKPSIELAYTIGTIHGDGSVSKDESRYQYIVKLEVVDKEFVEVFSRMISRLLDVSYHKPYWSEREIRHDV